MENETLFAWGDQVKATVSPDGSTGTVEALGIRFGNPAERDFYGDFFSADTDFGKHRGNGMAATLNHRIPMYKNDTSPSEADALKALAKMKFAHAIETETTEAGILARHVLDLSNEYEKTVFELAKGGALRWSSGTASHLVDRDDDGHIKTWHVIEWAYTPQPAEHRLPLISPVRSLEGIKMRVLADVKTVEPKDDKPSSVAVADADNHTEEATSTEEGNQDMTTEATNEAPQGTNDSAVLDAVKGIGDSIAALNARIDDIEAQPTKSVPPAKAPAVNKTGLGDSEAKGIAQWLRTDGRDSGGVSHLKTGSTEIDLSLMEAKASNATDMNITTDADGGYAVPTGHYQNIVARRDEMMIANKVGVLPIPGRGTTVNVPVDNEADGEFVSTSEAATFDLDSPAVDQKAMTLVKYTKRIILSDELMDDEDSKLMSFLENWIARGWAKTHNSLFVTEILANGTAAGSFDATAAIGGAEIPEIQYSLPDGYEDDAAWVMRKATTGYLRGLTGNDFLFAQTPYAQKVGNQFSIDGYPVYNSSSVPAIGTGNKSVVFGNFGYVGVRMPTELKVIIDPYTLASAGQVRRLYSFRTVYKVLQPEAVVYFTHPTA